MDKIVDNMPLRHAKYLFMKSNNIYSHSDLPEDFFEVTEKDVWKMMQDLQKNV